MSNTEHPHTKANRPSNPVLALLDLSRQTRKATSAAELRFLLVNDSHALTHYRQSALWLPNLGIQALSGVTQLEANAPYTQWLNRLCTHLAAAHPVASPIHPTDIPNDLSQEWNEWLPSDLLWVPWSSPPPNRNHEFQAKNHYTAGGLLLARDVPWSPPEVALLSEWLDIWSHAWSALFTPPVISWRLWRSRFRTAWSPLPNTPWWRQRRVQIGAGLLALLCFPVQLTVLAPGELVPAHPMVIRSPLDGTIDTFHIQPNQMVKKDQRLFGFDEILLRNKLAIAEQALITAETDYRQTTQQALQDTKYRPQLSVLTGKIEEKRAEVQFLQEQLQRSQVTAPQDGMALFDDASEWIGRPVNVGERILRIADPNETEIEIWLPLADAIALADESAVTLYLNASPLSPVSATVRYMSHSATQRPDGNYAYRVRAIPAQTTSHRIGSKGTAKLHGHRVPLIYWVLRRPLAYLRTTVGI